MLERLRIENFKAWRDTGALELAPLTILFGPNSSGKSSINHLLVMPKQTVRSSDRNSVFDLGDDDTPVSLGVSHSPRRRPYRQSAAIRSRR